MLADFRNALLPVAVRGCSTGVRPEEATRNVYPVGRRECHACRSGAGARRRTIREAMDNRDAGLRLAGGGGGKLVFHHAPGIASHKIDLRTREHSNEIVELVCGSCDFRLIWTLCSCPI